MSTDAPDAAGSSPTRQPGASDGELASLARARAATGLTTPGRRDLLLEALARGVPWPIALEAVASTAIDHDETVGTYTLDDEPTAS